MKSLILWTLLCFAAAIDWEYDIFQSGSISQDVCYGTTNYSLLTVLAVSTHDNSYVYILADWNAFFVIVRKINSKTGAIEAEYSKNTTDTSNYPSALFFHPQADLIIVAGGTTGSFLFPNPSNSLDGFLLGLSPQNLSLVWGYQTPTSSSDDFIGASIDPTNSSLIVIGGSTFTSTNYYGTPLGGVDFIFMKFEALTGNLVSSIRVGTASDDIPKGFAIALDGSFYFTFSTEDLSSNCSLVKFDAQGNWSWNYAFPYFSKSVTTAWNGTNNIVFLFGGTSNVYATLILDEGNSMEIVWNKTVDVGTAIDAVFHPNLNEFYTTGYSSSSSFLGLPNNGPAASTDIFIFSIDMEGEIHYKNFFGSESSDYSNYIGLDNDNISLWVGGTTNGDVAATNQGEGDEIHMKIFPPQKHKNESSRLGVILGVSLGLGLVFIISASLTVVWLLRRRTKSKELGPVEDQKIEMAPPTIAVAQERQAVVESLDSHWEIDFTELQIGKELGSGAFGTVYKATYRNSECVVKQQKSSENNKSMTEFLKEANAVKRIKPHDNVCNMLGVCTRPEHPICIVMEYVDGGSLEDCLINDKIELSNANLLRIFEDVAAGMCHVHAEKLLHCDLACRNLLVSFNSKDKFTVKVADFGLARISEYGVYQGTKSSLFPIRWSAPEVLRGSKMSRASDVWSFGVVMWEIMESKLPYVSMSNAEVVDYVCNKKILPAPTRIPCPDPFYELMKSCWRFYPADRPSFQDLLKNIKELQSEMGAENSAEEIKNEKTEKQATPEGATNYNTEYNTAQHDNKYHQAAEDQ